MKECSMRGCNSYAINIDPKEMLCDVCYYKDPLLTLLAIIHGDGGHYTSKHGISKSTADAVELIYLGKGIIDEGATKTWETRLVEEYKEMSTKTLRLEDFMHTPTFAEVDSDMQGYMYEQIRCMEQYLHILTDRMELAGIAY